MNKRQQKKAFKKQYGMNPKELIEIYKSIDWQDTVNKIAEAWREYWLKYVEFWNDFCKGINDEDTEKAADK